MCWKRGKTNISYSINQKREKTQSKNQRIKQETKKKTLKIRSILTWERATGMFKKQTPNRICRIKTSQPALPPTLPVSNMPNL